MVMGLMILMLTISEANDCQGPSSQEPQDGVFGVGNHFDDDLRKNS